MSAAENWLAVPKLAAEQICWKKLANKATEGFVMCSINLSQQIVAVDHPTSSQIARRYRKYSLEIKNQLRTKTTFCHHRLQSSSWNLFRFFDTNCWSEIQSNFFPSPGRLKSKTSSICINASTSWIICFVIDGCAKKADWRQMHNANSGDGATKKRKITGCRFTHLA